MTVVEFEHEEFLDLIGTRLTVEEVEARVSMMGAAPEGVQGTLQRFDVSPNRPDMLSIEGIARAFRGFLGLETGLPKYDVKASDVVFSIEASVASVRPFAVGAVVRDVDLTESLLKSIIDLQEKLHTTHGRKRKKVAIGIHDMDRVQPPFVYRAVEPSSVRFVPLGVAEEWDLQQILDRHEKGIEYRHILEGHDRFPVILDREGVVLSFPPIINGIATQLSPETTTLFLDVTGTDRDAVHTALAILCASLAERGAKVESIKLSGPDGSTRTPDFSPKPYRLAVDRANALLGLTLSPTEVAECLRKMRYDATVDGDAVSILAPGYRDDILHEWDLIEDVGIGYGFDRVGTALPRHQTSGVVSARSELKDGLRALLAGHGYQEVMSLTVAPPEEPWESPKRVTILNPVVQEQSRMRSSLLPGLLSFLALNKHRDLPQRVFEVGDAVRGSRNVVLLAGVSLHAKAGFTEMKSLLLAVLRDVGAECEIRAEEDANYLDGRCAILSRDDREIARFGEVHPRVVTSYDLGHPAVAFELDVSALP